MLTDFKHWLRNGDRGSNFVYHTGLLMADRVYAVPLPSGSIGIVANVPISTLADYVYNAYKSGLVDLAQYKIGEGMYDYIAYRR